MAVVYLHKTKDTNEVFYVGIGKSKKRAFDKHRRSNIWKSYVDKHGVNVYITHENICWEDACLIEIYLISFWRENSNKKLCNLTDGGEGVLNVKLSNKVILYRNKKIKESWTNERRKRYSEIFSGINNPYYDKKHSEEVRKKMSQNSNPRKNITEEHKIKISISNKGKKRTEETRQKMSNLMKGKVSWNKGISCKEETKIKLSESLKKYHKKRKNEIHYGGEANNTEVSLERMD
jgi:hypothetical protein